MLRYRSTFDDLLTGLRPPRRARTATRTRPGDAWQNWRPEVPDGQEEHEVAEALFDLANMFAAGEPAAIGSPRITAGPKSKRQRLKLQQQQERQAEQARQKQQEAKRTKRVQPAHSGRHVRNAGRPSATDSHNYAPAQLQPQPQMQQQTAQQQVLLQLQQHQQQAPVHSHPTLPQGSLQATAFQMQQQRDKQALHAAQQQAHLDLAAQLAASPEAAAIAAAWEHNPAAAAAALASTGPAAFAAAGLLPSLAGTYAQPGTMDHYGAVHNVAAAAALQQKGWGNPGNIDGFSELSHAQQLAFAEAQLRATAQQFAAEQQQAAAQQQSLLAVQAQQQAQQQVANGNNGGDGMNGSSAVTMSDTKPVSFGQEAPFPRCASHVYIAHYIEHQTKQRAKLAAETAAKQEALEQQMSGEAGIARPQQQQHHFRPQGTPIKQEGGTVKQESRHSSQDRRGVADIVPQASALGGGGYAAGHLPQPSSVAMIGNGFSAGGSFSSPSGANVMHTGSSPPNDNFSQLHHQGNGFGPGGPMTPQHVGNQSGCQSLEAQRQQYAAQLGQRALLSQQGGGGSAFPQNGQNSMQNGFATSAAQGSGQLSGQCFGQGPPGVNGGGGAYSLASLLPPAALAQLASSAGMQMDSKLLAELHAQQQQLHQHQHQHQQVNGVKATQASRFQDFAGDLHPNLNLSQDEGSRLLIHLQQQQMRQAQLEQQQQHLHHHFGQPSEFQSQHQQQHQHQHQHQQHQHQHQHQQLQQNTAHLPLYHFKTAHEYQQQQHLQGQEQQDTQGQHPSTAVAGPAQALSASPSIGHLTAPVTQLPLQPPPQPLPDLSPAAAQSCPPAGGPPMQLPQQPLPSALPLSAHRDGRQASCSKFETAPAFQRTASRMHPSLPRPRPLQEASAADHHPLPRDRWAPAAGVTQPAAAAPDGVVPSPLGPADSAAASEPAARSGGHPAPLRAPSGALAIGTSAVAHGPPRCNPAPEMPSARSGDVTGRLATLKGGVPAASSPHAATETVGGPPVSCEGAPAAVAVPAS